ncbi:MAG: methyltransferase domain-containing protein [Oceanicaulis sp.]
MTRLKDAYFAREAPLETESERLRALDAFYAAPTRSWLEETVAFTPGMKILEAGAGSGGMLSWFAEKTGAHGDVLGLDIDLSRAAPPAPPVRHMQADLYAAPAEPEAFDLVYARLVLMHLPDPTRALDALSGWLKPGGVIAIADLDCSTCRPAEPDAPCAAEFAEAVETVRAAMVACELMDPAFGARLPALLEQAGFQDVRADPYERVIQGGSDWAEFMAHNNTIIGPLVGAAEAAETAARHMRSPAMRFHDQTLVRVTARKPEPGVDTRLAGAARPD